MRTIVREAYDTSGVPSTVLGPVLALARRLRAGGLPVSTGESIDAVRALAQVDLGRRRQVRDALRASLVKDPAHGDVFDLAFEAVFLRPHDGLGRDRPAVPPLSSGAGRDEDTTGLLAEAITAGDDATVDRILGDAVDRWAGEPDGRSVQHHVQRVLRGVDLGRLYRRILQPDTESDALQRGVDAAAANARMEEIRRRIEALVAASLGDRVGAPPPQPDALEDTPLLRAGPDELAALRSAVRPLARRLAIRLGHRARRRGRGTLEMRRTLRRSISTGGVPIDVVLKRRHPTKPDLVVLCDVSGSTAQFAPFTLALLHAVHQEFRRVRSFVFVDGIVEITDVLESSPGVLDPRHLLDRRGLMARDGRSDYALAFERFLQAWPDAVGPKTTVIVCGDARSHDRRSAAPAMAELARRSRRLYWLDPEPRGEWNLADSDLALYEMYCTDVFEVSTLRQLTECVARIA
ncbi:MAG: VWA domain-containing protein [Jiangellaceae bacterium]